MNHGLLLKPIEPDHYIGGDKLDNTIIRPDRDWRPWIPSHQEVQNLNGIEPNACTNFGTANALEILINHQFKQTIDLSDRWYAKASGTSVSRGGNDPHTVIEFARNRGVVEEPAWPFDSTIDTLDKFYASFPKVLYTVAVKLMARFEIKHSWVPIDYQTLYDALQYSPIGFSTYAWVQNSDGLYYRPEGVADNHWVVCVYAERNHYWLVLDSYQDGGTLLKKIAWDTLPMRAKRYQVKQQTDVNSVAWAKFVAFISSLWPL